ncbi:MAG: 2-C-methyl-D-erythritol 4-phosphate cytidylyltransferase [archaeon]
MATHAILLGGGSGTRMKNPVNKSFILLEGKPLIAYSLLAFQHHPEVNHIVVVIHKDWVQELMTWVNRFGITKINKIVEGGKERQDSVRNGLDVITQSNPKPTDIVLIHNAANPLITTELISECIRSAQQNHASVAAYRIKDTIKRVQSDGKIVETLQREELWGMQTPQCVEYELFLRAHLQAAKEGFYGTDDVQLVERLKVQPVVVDCGYENIKITTPEDLPFAEKILQKRKEKNDS